MDSQHRHELQHNELEKLLIKLNQFLEKHGNRISIAICVVTAAIVGSILWYRNSAAQEAAAWSMLNSASGPDDLVEVWDRHPGSRAAQWARLLEAEQRLSQGVQAMFLNVEAGRSDVEKSSKAFETLSELSGAPREIRERALFGLGRSLESLSDGNLKDAVAAYERLLERFPDSYYRDDVKKRLQSLAAGGSADFYNWFATFERPKSKEQKPHDTGILDDDDSGADLLRRSLEKGLAEDADGDEARSTDGQSEPAGTEPESGGDEPEPGDEAAPADEQGAGALTPPEPSEPDPTEESARQTESP